MRLYVNVKIISHSVGQGLAPAVRLLLMYDGLRILSNENAVVCECIFNTPTYRLPKQREFFPYGEKILL